MNLLITGAWGDAQRYITEIQKAGHNVLFLQDEMADLECDNDWVQGIICNAFFLHHFLDDYKNLKYIQLTSAGYDRVPLKSIKEKGISVYNAGGVYSIPIAESVITGVLCLFRKTDVFYKNQNKHLWKKQRDLRELHGSRVLIVGCGSVGSECAVRFSAFGTEVLGVDIAVREDKRYHAIYGMDMFDEVLKTADIVVLTVPLTDETRHLIDKRRLSLVKSGAVIVNVSRGAVVDTEALVCAMDRLGGAVLDVFENEPLQPDSPLWDIENVIITPHNSFVGEFNGERLYSLIKKNLAGEKI